MIETIRMALAWAWVFATQYWVTSLLLFVGGGVGLNIAYWTVFMLRIMFGPGPK